MLTSKILTDFASKSNKTNCLGLFNNFLFLVMVTILATDQAK